MGRKPVPRLVGLVLTSAVMVKVAAAAVEVVETVEAVATAMTAATQVGAKQWAAVPKGVRDLMRRGAPAWSGQVWRRPA
jgi:hypothetical protein